jgi:RNA methyltransferase, TrmH family
VLLEGVHALKHAVRFGASIRLIVTPDETRLRRLLEELAPDVGLPEVTEVPRERWRRLVPRELPSPVLAVAARPPDTFAEALATTTGRVVVLEHPRHLGNLGAAVRVAAAAGAAGLAVVGDADPWHPTAVRAGAGLQFALPVARLEALPPTSRPLVAVDPEGRDLHEAGVDEGAVLLFGTERAGLSPALRDRAHLRVSIPMRPGVSSLNLATAVGVALYAR